MEEEHIQREMSNSKDSKLKEGTNQSVAVKSPGLDPPSGQPDLASMDNQILVPSPFQNDINVQDNRPFIPECELIFEGGLNSLQLFDGCQKNPGHGRFIPVNEFQLAHLDAEYRTKKIEKLIRDICKRTVKISVKYTSPNRPDTYPDSTIPYPYSQYKGNNRVERVGSGIIVGHQSFEENKPCPCSSCKTSGNPVMGYWRMWVKTASHVVFDDLEAESVVCDVFYNTEKREGVKFLYGVRGGTPDDYDVPGRCKSDIFYILCVCHDRIDRTFGFLMNTRTNVRVPFSLIVSHPHGRSKHITIGDTCRMIIPKPPKHQHGSPIKFSPGLVECRLSKNAGHLMPGRLAKFLGLEFCRPRRRYTVSHVLVVFPPKDSRALCKGIIGRKQWVIFHKDTLFGHEGCIPSIFRLEGVLFNISRAAKELFPEWDVPFYMEYDAPTCQGSSGAHVLNDGNYWHIDSLYSSSPHSGESMERKNTNRSGQWFCSQV